eukprot:531250-Pleurochrysis_carterae.AAC.4
MQHFFAGGWLYLFLPLLMASCSQLAWLENGVGGWWMESRDTCFLLIILRIDDGITLTILHVQEPQILRHGNAASMKFAALRCTGFSAPLQQC